MKLLLCFGCEGYIQHFIQHEYNILKILSFQKLQYFSFFYIIILNKYLFEKFYCINFTDKDFSGLYFDQKFRF